MVTLGYSHKFNGLKFRILYVLYTSKEPMSVRDIEFETGIHHTNISSAMSYYQKIRKRNGTVIKLPYIRRLEARGPNGLYYYTITKKGKEAYFDYLQRVKDGKILNRIKYPDHPVKEDIKDFEFYRDSLVPYIKINKRGMEMGLQSPAHALLEEGNRKHHHDIPESQRRREGKTENYGIYPYNK